MTGKSPTFPILLGAIIFLQVFASFTYPIAKIGLDQIEPYTFAFYRFVIAGIVLLLLSRLQKRRVPIARKDVKRIVLLGVLIIIGNQLTFLIGQALTAAGHGAVLFATTPVWVFVMALILLRERMVWRRLVGIVLAVIGVVLMVSAGAINVGTDYLLGDLILLVSVLAWALYTVLGKPLVERYGALRMTAYCLSIGAVVYFPYGLYCAVTFDYTGVGWEAWGSVAFMALGLSGVVYVLWYWILKYMDASRIAVYHNIQPVIATALAYVMLKEPVTMEFLAGGTAVLFGVIIAELPQRHRAATALRDGNV